MFLGIFLICFSVLPFTFYRATRTSLQAALGLPYKTSSWLIAWRLLVFVTTLPLGIWLLVK